MEEKTDKTVPDDVVKKNFERTEALQINLLTENLAALAFSLQSLNSVVLSIVHNIPDFKVPEWKDAKEVEDELGKVITECIEKVNKLYGLGKADKS